MSEINEKNQKTGFEIAVIGMAGRFPGAKNINEFWENLKNGVDSISFLTEEEVKKAGIDSQLLENPHYVKSKGGVLENKECFDAAFFGFTPKEAELMDPQMRILHEVAWEALEHAGYNPENYQGLIGFYAGASENFHWRALSTLSEKSADLGIFAVSQLVDRGFVTTRISYKFNLKGPSISVQTACSTSLVAIHLACRGILSGDCNMALAGGVSLGMMPNSGYLYQEGIILSPDGYCRAFDADAKGTVGGEGVGVVVLKSLDDAIADGDYIHAVIKSTAINNDGISKVGFSAPSIEGQAEVIYAALVMAEVEPESISYIETHGTGTTLGDPVEIDALKLAFNTSKKGFCGLGSVKTNIGHLDTTAGVAGFIKTVLALKHRQIPPSLHFNTPNPKIDFKNSPFYVVRELSEWKSDGKPLRAGISAFGIGGTNAHVILEEPPTFGRTYSPSFIGEEKGEWRRKYQLILLSAKTQPALDKTTENLRNYLKENLLYPGHPINPANPGFNLADAAYTLQVGRKAFEHRKILVCSDSELNEAIDGLSSPDSEKVRSFVTKGENKPAAFMFPGQGAQYVNMGLGIYQTEPVFQEEMDRCFEILEPIMGYDIKEILYPNEATRTPRHQDRGVSIGSPCRGINQTEITQPVIFSFEYALAKLLMKWGIKPYAMIGHSIGEYVAACLSGVFSLEDALKLVAARGKLMQDVSTGSMLSVPLSEEELRPLLKEEISLALAAVNAPSLCVVSGPHEQIDKFAKQLEEKGCQTRKIHTSHAFHSEMMDDILNEFEEKVKQIKLNNPSKPFLSNLTGKWIQQQEAIDPAYWVKHLRHTVRFATGVEGMIKKEISVFIEVGPGKVLSTFVRQTAEKLKKENRFVVNLVRHPKEDMSDNRYLLDKVGQLWLYGTSIDWSSFYDGERRYRLPLPTYPFEGARYWIDGDPFKIGEQRFLEKSGLQKKPDIADWFYVPVWKQSFSANPQIPIDREAINHWWLLFMDPCGLGVQLANRLKQEGVEIIEVRAGAAFTKENDRHYTINPANSHDYEALLEEVIAGNKERKPLKFIHLWGVTGSESLFQESSLELELERMDEAQNMGMFSLIFLAQALGKRDLNNEIQIEVVTDNMQKMVGEERLCPEKATVLGAVRVMVREYPHLNCRSIDVVLPGFPSRDYETLLDHLFEEWMTKSPGRIVAFRYNMFWVQNFEPIRLEETLNKISKLREQGVYLITGGLGGIGLELARYLAKSANARLVLTGRSSFPAKKEWEKWLQTHDQTNDVSQKIQKLQEIEALGAEILVFKADVSNLDQMQKVVDQTKTCFGQINGVIHSAGLADYAGVIQRRSKEATEKILAAKVKGTLVLDRILKDAELDFFVLCSSLASVLAPFGEVGYTAANAFLDAFTHYRNSLGETSTSRTINTVSINWTSWKEVGMAVEAKKRMVGRWEPNLDEGILSTEGVEAFNRIMGSNLPQVGVSTRDLTIILERLNIQKQKNEALGVIESAVEKARPGTLRQRPELSTSYVAPRDEIEQTLAYIWKDFLGIEQIGIHDDFFELGGDSLKAVALLAKIHKELNLSLTLAKFFNKPTINGLAEYEYEYRRDMNESIEEKDYLSIEKTEEKEFYSLSPAQRRLYVVQQMEPQSISYNMPEVVLFEGSFDKEKMESAFKALIKRHESLRTAFEVIEENPVQRIYNNVEFGIEYDNAERTSESEPYESPDGSSSSLFSEIHTKRITEHFIRPFNLSQAPLLRVGLIKIAEKKHILVADMHHIISDGYSLRILVNEFISLYRGKTLPELRLQYKDFSQWQNKRLVSGRIKKHEEYWLREFKGEIPVLKIPTDFKRPQIKSFEGDYIEFDFGKDGTEKFKEFAKAEDVTLFILLFAIYNVFLHKLSGQEDIIVGTVAAGRRHADLEQVIGMFVNTLALRNYPKPNYQFIEFLKEVKERSLHSFDNQDYQFDDLVEKLLPDRDTSRNPLFDAMFAFTSQEMLLISDEPSGFGESDLKIKNYNYEANDTKFDLILGTNDFGEKLKFIFIYSTKLFKKSTIKRFINYFKEIVFSILGNKFIHLKDISVSYELEVLKSDLYKNVESNFEF
jgi:acyl transferase domain-containing protein/acyl carrier protein